MDRFYSHAIQLSWRIRSGFLKDRFRFSKGLDPVFWRIGFVFLKDQIPFSEGSDPVFWGVGSRFLKDLTRFSEGSDTFFWRICSGFLKDQIRFLKDWIRSISDRIWNSAIGARISKSSDLDSSIFTKDEEFGLVWSLESNELKIRFI